MVKILELSARSALMRTESRGVHYRTDYPMVDHDNWLKEIIIRQVGNTDQITTSPVKTVNIALPTGKFSFEKAVQDAMKNLSSGGI